MTDSTHRIGLDAAVRFVRRAVEHELLPVRGWSLDADLVRGILAQPGAIGLRKHLALGDDAAPTSVMVGVDAEGRNLFRGVLAEMMRPCPPFCADGSPFATPQ